MKYPYLFQEGKFLPLIPLKLQGVKEWVEFRAYIDTGASYSLFHADVAEVLGLELEKGDKQEMVLGDGDILEVYLHHVAVSIAGKEFMAFIGFSKGLDISFYILGRRDVFEKFTICFHEKEKYVEFTPL